MSARERPILFSAPMVRSILAGTKTQTRRVLSPQPQIDDIDQRGAWYPSADAKGALYYGTLRHFERGASIDFCPHGAPGDRLWVRETMRRRDAGQRTEAWTYDADGAAVTLERHDPRVPAMISWAHHKETDVCVSIHMPRWASRIDLEVTSVRCERLQDITEEDARAEGVDWAAPQFLKFSKRDADDREDPRQVGYPSAGASFARDNFQRLWDEINGKRAPWSANPWVWVVSFRRVKP